MLGVLVYSNGVLASDPQGDLFYITSDPSGNVSIDELKAGSTTPIVLVSAITDVISSIAVDNNGNVFVTDENAGTLDKVTAGDLQPLLTQLNFPSGLAIAANGNIYVGDNDGILLYSSTGVSSRIHSYPVEGLALDAAGDLFAITGGVVTAYLSDGATATYFNDPQRHGALLQVAADSLGNVYAAAYDNGILRHSMSSNTEQAIAGDLVPLAIAIDGAGILYVASEQAPTGNTQPPLSLYKIQYPSANLGSVNLCAAGQASAPACSNTLAINFTVNSAGTFGASQALIQGAPNLDFTTVSDGCQGPQVGSTEDATSDCQVVVKFTPTAPGLRNGAVNLTDTNGNVLATTYVGGTGIGPAVAYSPTGQSTAYTPPHDSQSPTQSQFNASVVDQRGNIFLLSDTVSGASEVDVLSPGSTKPTPIITNLPGNPYNLAEDGAGNFFISTQATFVAKVPAGCGDYRSCGATVGFGFINTGGVAVDGAGDVFITDSSQNRVVEVPIGCVSASCQVTIAGNLNSPSQIAIDSSSNLYIADVENNRVLRFPMGAQHPLARSRLPLALPTLRALRSTRQGTFL